VPLENFVAGFTAAGWLHRPGAARTERDLANSVLRLATPADADGKDLRSMLVNPTAGPLHETLYWRVGKSGALRSGKWKLFRGGPRWELYDLEADPSEKREVSARHPELTQTLIERWETWSKTQAEPLWR
jgi:arylsulfatase A-like enzyme